MRYYTIQNDLIIADKEEALTKFYSNVLPLPNDYVINKYIVQNGELVLNPDYEQEEAEQREAEFKNKFFEIPNFGWFRKQPKGYSSAVESLNTAFNAVTIMQKLPAGMLIFYQEPDFTKPEECTEEWLIEHQTYSEEMTVQEFGAFYVGFMTAWNNQEHVNEEENADTTNE
jgi:hypothetical protein